MLSVLVPKPIPPNISGLFKYIEKCKFIAVNKNITRMVKERHAAIV